MAEEPSVPKLMGFIALVAVLGIPLVAYLWGTLNDVLALHFEPVRLTLSAAALALLAGLLVRFKRSLQSKEPRP